MAGLMTGVGTRERAVPVSTGVAMQPASGPGRPPILVLPVEQVRSQTRRLDGPAALIVDATHRPPPLQALVRILLLRRSMRACGGDLVLVAGPETADLLRRSGLDRSIPCHHNTAAAAHALS